VGVGRVVGEVDMEWSETGGCVLGRAGEEGGRRADGG